MRNLTSREMERLEKRHQKNLNEISKTLSTKTGIHHSHIRDKLHELVEKIPADKRIRLKMHMLRVGTPIAGVLLAEAMTGGTASQEVVLLSAVGGALAGWFESKGAEKRLAGLEREHAQKVLGRVRKVV